MMAIRLALMMSEIGSSRAAVLFTEQSTSIFFLSKMHLSDRCFSLRGKWWGKNENKLTKEKLVKGKVWCMVNYNEIYIVL